MSVLVIFFSLAASFVIGMIFFGIVSFFIEIFENFDAFLSAYLPIGSFFSLVFCLIWILGHSAENFVSTVMKDD